jgi:hypothetical protein
MWVEPFGPVWMTGLRDMRFRICPSPNVIPVWT